MNAFADTIAPEAERQAALYRRVAQLEADEAAVLAALNVTEASAPAVIRRLGIQKRLGVGPAEARLLVALLDAAPGRVGCDELRQAMRPVRTAEPVTIDGLRVTACRLRSAIAVHGFGNVIGSAYHTPFYWITAEHAAAVRGLLGDDLAYPRGGQP